MKILIIISTALALISATFNGEHNSKLLENHSPFVKYNLEILKKRDVVCQDPYYYINTANIEESKHENHDKIILYHGETYGVWLYQLIMKAFMFPEADEDWLPLRFSSLDQKINRIDLMKKIQPYRNDEHSEYTKIGISVTANLVSSNPTESAWGIVCTEKSSYWHIISGLGVMSIQKSLNDFMKENFVAESKWENFIQQKQLIETFIQIKRRLHPVHSIDEFTANFERLFPKVLDHYYEELQNLFHEISGSDIINDKVYTEGVALQIIMDQEIANELTYYALSYGYARSHKYEPYNDPYFPSYWKGGEIEPYSEIYEQVKNKVHFEQARVAMNHDFRSFPSRVRIKSIAGIMENPKDYKILKAMIKEMVNYNRKE